MMLTTNRAKLFDIEQLNRARTLIPESVTLRGGALEGSDGMKVDGRLTDTTLISVDNSPVHISATAVLQNCVIRGSHVFIEGRFTGKLIAIGDGAEGRFEFGAGCVVVGECCKGKAEMRMHFLADIEDLHVLRPAKSAAPASNVLPMAAS